MSNPSIATQRTAPSSKHIDQPVTPSGGTLRVVRPVYSPLLVIVGSVLLLFSLTEVAVRNPRFQAAVGAPSLGGRHHLLEMQVHYLNRLVATTGRVDCIFVGNSMVWQGINVRAFAQRYRDVTGQDITCYNFGVDGLPGSAAGTVAKMLVHDYQPRLLIYGTDARDYAVPADAPDATVVNEMAWLRYRNGHFSLVGWLYDHFYVLRYRSILRAMARFDDRQIFPREVESLMAANLGFFPDDRIGDYVSTSPDPTTQDGPIAYYFGLMSNYSLVPGNLAGLETVLQQAQQTRVLVVEMPVPETYMAFFGNGVHDHQRFIAELDQRTAEHGIPFWTTTHEGLISDEGWLDYSHLNTEGAQVFSRWLGERVGQAAEAWGLLTTLP